MTKEKEGILMCEDACPRRANMKWDGYCDRIIEYAQFNKHPPVRSRVIGCWWGRLNNTHHYIQRKLTSQELITYELS